MEIDANRSELNPFDPIGRPKLFTDYDISVLGKFGVQTQQYSASASQPSVDDKAADCDNEGC